ncbi:MAG: hypothetical protein SFU91_02445 [Chloroherpetonaceae bacterium]|nr:hypothetical protein [Chloroherpetonaceae bacterium]
MNDLKFSYTKVKRATYAGVITLFLVLGFSACINNPTDIINPTITDESLQRFPGGSANQVLQGVRTTFSTAVGNIVLYNAYVSDEYVNISTFLSPSADNPRLITSDDLSLPGSYSGLQNLKANAEFAITQVPLDNTLNANQRINATAQARFFRGMALLMLAENFANVPVTVGGSGLTSNQLAQEAINDFNLALPGLGLPAVLPSGSPASLAMNQTACRLALARSHRLRGTLDSAIFYANAALSSAGSTNYVYRALFDAQTNNNGVVPFLVTRTTRDLQPLPRLDFLDPKYTAIDSPIPVLKIEEAHLILAEAAIANGNFTDARTSLRNAVNAARRADSLVGFNSANTRLAVAAVGGNRPRSNTLSVRADANSPAIPNLIPTRPGLVTVFPTSFTSIRTSDIDALAETEEEFLRTLFLLRQEIFFLEGRRIADLGIRLPVWRRQLDVNPYGSGVGFDLSVVPDYIPGFANFNPGTHDMDAFIVSGNVVTCSVDMNRVLATNRAYSLRRP